MSWPTPPSTLPSGLPRPIPRGYSSPSDPAASSFLTLPPEIRNAVYDELFGAAANIKVRACHDDWRPVIDPAFCNRVRGSLSILSTCRQIYHEAATTIFASNTWTVYKDPSALSSELDQGNGAAAFLNSVQPYMLTLRKLTIPLDAACATKCKIHWDSPDETRFKDMQGPVKLLALTTQLWKAPVTGRAVEFTFDPIVAQESFHPAYAVDQLHAGLNVEVLNNVIQSLAEDSLDLKRYKQQLCEIAVTRDGRDGSVHFCVDWLDAPGRAFERHFSILDQGIRLEWKPVTVPKLLEFPVEVSNQIFAHVASSQDYNIPRAANSTSMDRVHFDSEAKTVQGPTSVLAFMCRELRFRFHD